VKCAAGRLFWARKVEAMNENLVSGSLSEQDVAAVKQALEAIRSKLPFLRGLDPETRKILPRMGDRSRGFVRKCQEVANQNPGMLPRAFDLDEFNRDIALGEALMPIVQLVDQLAELLADTQTAVRSDAYLAALTVYQSAKIAGKGTGLDGSLDELGRRFVRKSGTATNGPSPNQAAK